VWPGGRAGRRARKGKARSTCFDDSNHIIFNHSVADGDAHLSQLADYTLSERHRIGNEWSV
jgi:hypothetical protein